MKIAISTRICPAWRLSTIIEKARATGFDGIELAGSVELGDPRSMAALVADPPRAAAHFRDAGIEVACLATSAGLHVSSRDELARNLPDVREHVKLAARLGCPLVCLPVGWLPEQGRLRSRPERREEVIGRIVAALRGLVPFAVEHGVTLLLENTSDFPDSVSMWHFAEAADSPAVRCCWNVFVAHVAHDRPTTAIPRLATKIRLVRVCDAAFGASGRPSGFVPLGQGQLDLPRLVQILKGIGYRGFLVLDRLGRPSANHVEEALADAAKYLRGLLEEQPVGLSAYKGDKYRPRQGYDFSEQ